MASSSEVESEPTDGGFECPHCGGTQIIKDHGSGELICPTCGYVVREKSFDRGPEWRVFNQEQMEERSRSGPPMTETMHDRGLSTRIDYRNRDAKGKSLSPEKKAQMFRMRKWHKRGKIEDAQDRNLVYALGEVRRLSSQLGLPRSVQEWASWIYRKTVERSMTRGHSMEGMAAAAVYIECRKEDVPRTLAEIAEVSPAGARKIGRNQKYIEKELDVDSGISDPVAFISRFGSRLDISGETQAKAIELIEKAREERLVSGRKPSAVAAGALYIACVMTGERRTQSEIADAADITKVTIRNRYKELEEKLGISVEKKEGRLPDYKEETTKEKREKKPGTGEIEVENVKCENVVASVTFRDTSFDLKDLAEVFDHLGANYDPDVFPGVSLSPEGTKATFLIFKPGKANCVGTSSVKEARESPKLLAKVLAEKGFEVDSDPQVEIRNVVSRAVFNVTIDLSKLHISSYNTSYDPGSFPGLQLELDEPDVDFLLFASGQAVLHSKSEEDIEPALDRVCEILREFASGSVTDSKTNETIEWLEKKPRYVNLLNSLQEGATTPTKLAKRLDVKRETAEGYARSCSNKGLAELQKHGRGYRVGITEKGRKALNALSEGK